MDCRIQDKWDEYLNRIPVEKSDIYYRESYVKLYESQVDKALCIVCEDGDNILIMPFLRKEIDKYFDFETPYGYGGPITNTDDIDWVRRALDEIHECLRKQGYICGFMRFHPLLSNNEFGRYEGSNIDVIYDRNTVMIDTSMAPEDIWASQISSKNRNMIRKAEKNELVFAAEYDCRSLDEFRTLYNMTMSRLNADEFYFFDDDYYNRFVNDLKGSVFLGTIRKDNELICAALFMYSSIYGHYHLEGSKREYSGLGANNLLLWKAASEMHNLGVKQFHLGGGYDSDPDNSLLKFKKAFSRYLKEFYIGKEIFNNEVYTELCEKWKKNNPDKAAIFGNRLLMYRY